MAFNDDNVYRYTCKLDQFKRLESDELDEIIDLVHTDELTQRWGSVRSLDLVGKQRQPVADLMLFDLGLPVVNSKALEVVRPLLSNNVHVLEVECQGVRCWALNALWIGDAVVIEKSDVDANRKGEVGNIRDGVFLREKIAGELFGVPRASSAFISGKFLNVINEHGLTGLALKPLPIGCLV